MLADTGGLQIRDPDGAMWRLGGVEAGLPFSNLTSVFIEQSGQKTGYDSIPQMELAYIKSKYWIGAKDGLILYDDLVDNFDYENKWRVFQGYLRNQEYRCNPCVYRFMIHYGSRFCTAGVS